MKRIFLAFAIIASAITTGNAQDIRTDLRENMCIGFKLGSNYSNVYDIENEEFTDDPKFGLAIGGFLSLPLNKYIGLQPEVLYSQKGFQGKGSFLGSSYEFSRTTDYLDIPIFFAIKPHEAFNFV